MATNLPISFAVSPLPANFKGSPNDLSQAIAARLTLATQDQLALFVNGPAAPTSDSGPWIKNGQTWYVWDVGTGAYIPQVIEFQSLRYIAQLAAPDQTKYAFWIVLDGAGKAQAIKYYSGGAWKDVYVDTFAAIQTQFTALNVKPFRYFKSAATQTITSGAGATAVVYDAASYDPSAVVAASVFTAPSNGFYSFRAAAKFTLASGAPTGVNIKLVLQVGGGVVTVSPGQVTDNTDDSSFVVADHVSLTAGQQVNVAAIINTTGAATFNIQNDVTTTFFEGYKIQSS